jgi:hypothetical protein
MREDVQNIAKSELMTFENINRSNSGSNTQNCKEIGSTIDSEQLSDK